MCSVIYYLLDLIPFVMGVVLSCIILGRMRIYSSSGMLFSNTNDILAKPSTGKVEIGGLAFFPIVVFSLCVSLGVCRWLLYLELLDVELGISGDRILQVLMGCTLLYIVGLKNDVHGTFSRTRFLSLLAAASLFPLSGLWIRDLQGLFGLHEISIWSGMLLTMLWVIYLTEAIALMDDLDGLGVGITSVMLAIYLCFCLSYRFTLGALVSAAGLGVCLPYSVFKMYHPAWRKTFLGTAGSYVLGYLLSYTSLSLLHPHGVEIPDGTLFVVIGVTLVPCLDLLRLLRSRVQDGRLLQSPDRNLMQHRLMRMGVPRAWTPVLIAGSVCFLAVFNWLWVRAELNRTMLVVVDMLLWGITHSLVNYLIKHKEEKVNHQAWVLTYGREAWEADKPVEVIRKKREQFGMLGVPGEYIRGDETDFIPDGMSSFERRIKRLLDMIVAAGLLVIFAPLFLLCYLLIKWEDGGDAIYKQERIGRFGRPFMIYKFRSMRIDAEADGPMLSSAGKGDDPRLTKVGRYLRVHHLDELPQLWNVLIGDMAFIGYRPERKFYIDQIMEHDPRYTMLYQIRPGVTSYATLYNGYTDTMEKMLRRLTYDLYYLEHRSFWFDFKILWLTFISIIFGRKF